MPASPFLPTPKILIHSIHPNILVPLIPEPSILPTLCCYRLTPTGIIQSNPKCLSVSSPLHIPGLLAPNFSTCCSAPPVLPVWTQQLPPHAFLWLPEAGVQRTEKDISAVQQTQGTSNAPFWLEAPGKALLYCRDQNYSVFKLSPVLAEQQSFLFPSFPIY